MDRPASICSLLFSAIVNADPYVLPLIHYALQKHFSSNQFQIITSLHDLSNPTTPLLQITPYEVLDFTHLLTYPSTSMTNSYIIRKALIRKHYLHNTITSWWSKHPSDRNLKGHVPLTVTFELDYAEFLDEALVDCWELRESLGKEKGEWWILKPSMSDQGQGVRLFSREEGLGKIFEGWEVEESDADGEEGSDTPPDINERDIVGAGTMISQLRHFVAQRYVHPPLLLESHGNRKFHIRSYVLAVGALRTYVYREMLALFASSPYIPPETRLDDDSTTNLGGKVGAHIHLTNTCRQDGDREGSVARFWDLAETSGNLPKDWKDSVYDQICAATGTLFEAAAREQMIHFQTLENAFEIFGMDWMVDEEGVAWLLEVNAFPDFKQSGNDLKDIIQGLWDGVAGIAVKGFFCPDTKADMKSLEQAYGMRKVLEVDLGRR